MQSQLTTSDNGMSPQPPSVLYGRLFAAVQESGLFRDIKTFADARPRRAPAAIVAAYAANPPPGPAALRLFVEANFILPDAGAPAFENRPAPRDLRQHIAEVWSLLERPGTTEEGSAIGVRQRFIVPGGRFRELYYWDSYFSMLGLVSAGRQDLVEDMVDLFADLIDRFGHVPNGTRSYYLSRSQPPVFYLMVALSQRRADSRLVAAMRREHDYWMSGGRAVALPGGSVLNRYWDDADTPRDESWAEDVTTARLAARPQGEVWRDIRAGAESGWDFSSRWLADGRSMESVRTTRVIPCCLNALLYGLETALAETGDTAMALAAQRRKAAMAEFHWNDDQGFFADYLIDEGITSDQPTAAMLYPLFSRCAVPTAAERTIAAAARHLVAPGGLRTTLVQSGQQWDAPNGWAPLQWIACEALENYGASSTACDIALRWIATVEAEFLTSGRMLEKYDVESGGSGDGGEYLTQEGFGWTNGVTAVLIERYGRQGAPPTTAAV